MTELEDCLVSLCSQSVSSRLRSTDFTIEIYRTDLLVCKWNLLFHPKERTWIESVWEQENIWTKSEVRTWDWKKIDNEGLHNFQSSANIVRENK
jgi:hypothetical protein